MKVTTDRKYLMEVIDRANYAEMFAVSHTGESAECAKYDFLTATHYFVYLAMRALKDWKFAKKLENTLANVSTHSPGKLDVYLNYLIIFVHAGRWVMYSSGNGPSIVERIWDAIRRWTGFGSGESMEEVKKNFKSFTRCEMKFTTDAEFLKKVIDRASNAVKDLESAGEREVELIKDNVGIVLGYLNWLGVKALESEEYAKNMTNTLRELREYPSAYTLEEQITHLCNFVGHGYTLKYDPDNKNMVENLARDFDEFMNRLDTDTVREFKKRLLEFQRIESKLKKVRRQTEEKSEEEVENVMYG